MISQDSFSEQRLIGIAMFVVVLIALSASRLEVEPVEMTTSMDTTRTEIAAVTR